MALVWEQTGMVALYVGKLTIWQRRRVGHIGGHCSRSRGA